MALSFAGLLEATRRRLYSGLIQGASSRGRRCDYIGARDAMPYRRRWRVFVETPKGRISAGFSVPAGVALIDWGHRSECSRHTERKWKF
jgi:hypothetical protein